MRNIKISTRLTIAFGLTLALAIIIAAIGIYTNIVSIQESHHIQLRNQLENNILIWMRNTEANGERTIAAANTTEQQLLANYQKKIKATSEKINQSQDIVGSSIELPEAKELFNNVLDARAAYTDSRATALNELATGTNIINAQDYFRNKMPALIANYVGAIEKLYEFQDKYTNQLFNETENSNRLAIAVITIVTVLAVLIGLLMAWLISRSIANPLKKAVTLAEKISQRDLSVSIKPSGKDEIAQLELALLNMSQGLNKSVKDIQQGSNSIAAAAAQISTGNLDLSSRTEQQASSLAQTAATMEELTATIKQNADNTKQANSLSSAATATANDGGKNVHELVSTMAEINAKSRQVTDIIGVIDSIAFQTNILALNAAVEAARAGEQGRGFAVVATEVRSLAQRSATAAKEIKDLIDASVGATSKGNQQAELTGATMQEIVLSINRVTDIMGEIHAANTEQTAGIEEINAAVAQMDDVTRQNASLVEESAAAAASLQEQADALANLAATFKLIEKEHEIIEQPAKNSPKKYQSNPTVQSHNEKPGLPAQALIANKSATNMTLRSPNRPALQAADTGEWTEF